MQKVKVEVCFGTTCHVMGGSELLDIESELDESIIPYVDLCGIGCLDFCHEANCGKAPFVRIDGQIMGDMTMARLKDEITSRVNNLLKNK